MPGAKKAGVVPLAHGKLMATRRGLAAASDPAGCFDWSLDALMAAGPLSSQRLRPGGVVRLHPTMPLGVAIGTK